MKRRKRQPRMRPIPPSEDGVWKRIRGHMPPEMRRRAEMLDRLVPVLRARPIRAEDLHVCFADGDPDTRSMANSDGER